MKKGLIYLAACTFILGSCGGSTDEAEKEAEKMVDEMMDETMMEEEVEEVNPLYGDWTLTDMMPIGDLKPTAADEKYLADSKARTVNSTILTLNEDGTFKRVFPHPSGNGETNTWTGKYDLDEAAGTLVLHAEMNGKTMDVDYKIEEKSADKLALSTSMGKLMVNYIHMKK